MVQALISRAYILDVVMLGPTITLRHKKYELLVTKCSLSALNGIRAADSESEVGFALSRQNFKLFAFFKICIK